MRSKLPSKNAVLAAYFVLAAALTGAAVKTRIDTFLYFLVVPIFFAAILYPRVVFLAMQFIAILSSILGVHFMARNLVASERTVYLLGIIMWIVSETLHRLKAARDRTEQALRESEHRLRTIIDAEPECVKMLAADGTLLDMNPAGLAMIEAGSLEEVQGRSVYPLVKPEYRAAFQALTEESFRGKTGTLEFEMVGLRGTPRWILTKAVPFRNAQGAITACLGVSCDLTERKRGEARLTAFSHLSQRLGLATTPSEAARVILEVADNLFGWDAAFLHLYATKSNGIIPLVTMAIVNGQRSEVPSARVGRAPSPILQRVLCEGPQLILRPAGVSDSLDLIPIGDRDGRSASLLFVPIYNGAEAMGVLSIQSYRNDAYNRDALQTLQALANHSAETLARIQETAERQRAEEELRRSEARYQTVIENLGEGLLILDLEDVVLYSNLRMTELCGYTPAELRGKKAYQLLAPSEDWPLVLARMERRAQGISERYETRLHRKDGRQFIVEVSATPNRDPAGQILGKIAAFTDITERKQAEIRTAAFSNLGQKLSATHTPEDAARIIAGAAQELLGWHACTLDLYSAEQNLIQPLLSIDTIEGRQIDVLNPFAGQPPSPMMLRLLAEGSQLILRDASENPPVTLTPFGDTTRRSESLMFVPIRNGLRMIGSLSAQSYKPNAYTREDLATLQALADHCGGALERLRAARELRRSDECFAKAFQSSPIAIGICSLADDRLLDVNASLIRLLGYSREELVGRTTAALGIWADPEDQAELLKRLCEQRSVRELECKVHAKGQKAHDVLASAEMIELGGEACWLFTFQDMTERLNLEAQLRQAQKMEAVGKLSAGVAHDFNNIMTIIQGHTNLVLRNLDANSSAQESLLQVARAADRAATLTRQLLAFSRKQIMKARLLDLNEAVGNTVRMLHRLLGENIELHIGFAPQLPPVFVDMTMLDQAIINVALNARDAMPEGGRLTIGTRLVDLDPNSVLRNPEARPGLFVCLSVTDTGSGMDAEVLGRIFEPFFTTKEIGKGTGLGLAMVYGIIKQHQGWIEVQSRVGQGTTFEFFLPCSPRSIKAPAAETSITVATPEINDRTETILLVEDEPGLRDLVRQVLEMYGYGVLEAGDGPRARRIWAEHHGKIDLLLTDVVMPGGVSGFELAQNLKAERPGLKVVYTSGYSVDLSSHTHELKEGVNFLPKPYDPPKLAKVIRACLDGG